MTSVSLPHPKFEGSKMPLFWPKCRSSWSCSKESPASSSRSLWRSERESRITNHPHSEFISRGQKYLSLFSTSYRENRPSIFASILYMLYYFFIGRLFSKNLSWPRFFTSPTIFPKFLPNHPI